MSELVILITGANTGLGFETVKALAKSPEAYKIILCGRSLEKAQAAAASVPSECPGTKSTVTAMQLDVTDDASIAAAFKKVEAEFPRLDALVNNAGASFDNNITDGKMSTRAAWNASWDTNIVGNHIVTETFAPMLLKSSKPRLLFITSGTSSLAETLQLPGPEQKNPAAINNTAPPPGWPKPKGRPIISYRSTKAGLNMMMREWDKVLRNDGVKVFAVAPGFLATGLGGDPEATKKLGALDPSVGGESVRKVIAGDRDTDAGMVVRNYASPIQAW